MNAAEPVGALALVGPGRAGTTIAAALAARGWRVIAVSGRELPAGQPNRGETQPRPPAAPSPSARTAAALLAAPTVGVEEAARGADLVVIGTPDAAIESVAARLAPVVRADALVIHLSGARGLDALAALPCRVGALHPLQTLPSVEAGLARLPGSWCAIAGDPGVDVLAVQLELRPVHVTDEDRVRYHAAACIASNHLVALLHQVERVSPVPLEALMPLIRATLENVAELGSAAALTGPVARGDVATVRAHLDALPERERDAYRALARVAHELSESVAARPGDDELAAVLR